MSELVFPRAISTHICSTRTRISQLSFVILPQNRWNIICKHWSTSIFCLWRRTVLKKVSKKLYIFVNISIEHFEMFLSLFLIERQSDRERGKSKGKKRKITVKRERAERKKNEKSIRKRERVNKENLGREKKKKVMYLKKNLH